MIDLTLSQVIALESENKKLHKQIREHRLTQLFWECTVRCNQDCLHCGSNCRRLSGLKDMDIDTFCHVLDGIAKYQDPSQTIIIITGGEPLMREDLEECGRQISERGFRWSLVTNGMLLTEERFRRLREAGMHSVSISLDGFEFDHNWLHGSDSYSLTCNAIRLVNDERDMASEVVTCINGRNIDYLPEMAGQLLNLGVERWRLYMAYPVGNEELNHELQLEPYQIKYLMNFIRKQREEKYMYVNFGCEGFLGEYEGEVRDHLFSCQAGISIGSIHVNGEIGGCTTVSPNYLQGNIYEDEFMDIWNTCFRQFRNHEWMKTGVCTHCKVFRYCQGGSMHLRDEEGQMKRCIYCSIRH